jgi:hypothetical protein
MHGKETLQLHAGQPDTRDEVIMLVTFSCDAYADITMFGDVAVQLLKLMGHSGTVPGAILAEDVPDALARLKSAIELEKAASAPEHAKEEEDGERTVGLHHRAIPLIELLSAAAEAKSNVMWDKNT